jgi:tetratricopeptide (TPR) repeat protein
MIVKNEEKIIKRCLQSVKEHIDYWVILDTGSTDNTKQMIRDFFNEHNIPGELYDSKWVNFGHNRTEAIQKAINKADYILLLDADMELIVQNKDFKEHLTNDVYLVMQGCHFIYRNVRLVNGRLHYKYSGVTHEYLECLDHHTKSNFDKITFNDHQDGYNRTEKYERDVKLLLNGLKDEPDNERYYFYLAQSYREIKQFNDAIKFYKMRIDKEGWIEEVWYSIYMIGKCYEALDDFQNALHYYLTAYEKYPKRSESLYSIVKYYREHGQTKLAYIFAKTGVKIPFPTQDTLFLDKMIYDYGFQFELSILYFYMNKLEKGYKLSEKLIMDKNCPNHIANQVLYNIQFYMKKLSEQVKHYKCYTIPVRKLDKINNECNSTILYHPIKKKFILCTREVNYRINEQGVYEFFSNTIDTSNHILEVDNIHCLDAQSDIVIELSCEIERSNANVTGFEDIRLVFMNGKVYGVCTAQILNPLCINEMVLLHLSDDYKIEKVVRLKGPNPYRCEKNWVPVVNQDKLILLYQLDPIQVYSYDIETGEPTQIANHTTSFDFTSYRGGSQLIPFQNGYLYIVHQIGFQQKRYYYHRFIYLNSNFEFVSQTPLFYFFERGIEFVCGLAISYCSNYLYITFGIGDKKAYLVELSAIEIVELLK